MQTKFKIDDQVFESGEKNYVGKVVDVEVNGQLSYPHKEYIVYHVLWPNGSTHTYEEDEIYLCDLEADRILKDKLKVKMMEVISSFDAAFEQWQEITDMCNKSGDYVSSFRDDPELGPLLKKFEEHVEAGGWSASSIYC